MSIFRILSYKEYDHRLWQNDLLKKLREQLHSNFMEAILCIAKINYFSRLQAIIPKSLYITMCHNFLVVKYCYIFSVIIVITTTYEGKFD